MVPAVAAADHDLDVTTQKHQEPNEPVQGEASQPPANQRGDLGLIDLEDRRGSGVAMPCFDFF